MPTREQVAAAFRKINSEHRPYYEGTREFWATMTVAQIAGWADAAIQAVKLDGQFRAETGFKGDIFGSKGCPPWAFRVCEGENHENLRQVPDQETNIGVQPRQGSL